MRLVRRKEELILGRNDFLYVLAILGLFFISIGVYLSVKLHVFAIYLFIGAVFFILFLTIPVKNVIINFKKAQLSIVTSSITGLFKQEENISVKNIKDVSFTDYFEDLSGKKIRNVLLTLNNGETRTLTTIKYQKDALIGPKYNEKMGLKTAELFANALNQKIQELKKE